MVDAVCLESKEIILHGYFNTDLHKQNKSWLQMLENNHLYQLISTPTKITATSKMLIDHIYVSNKSNGIETCDPVFGCSDHFPICLLLRKLAVYGLSLWTLTLLVSFLTDRKQTMHVNASTSDIRSLKYGIPQGSVLGPLLFSMYINDLPLLIKACCELFADDTTIHSSNFNVKKL